MESLATGPRLRPTPALNRGMFLTGATMLALTLTWPKVFYPFVWTSLVFILEPLNCWLGRRHFLQKIERGDWRLVASLALGALICGFFWEMWNYYSYPKWIYHTPGAQFLHVFEMPLLGYGGYIPFALELWALKSLLSPRAQGTGTGGSESCDSRRRSSAPPCAGASAGPPACAKRWRAAELPESAQAALEKPWDSFGRACGRRREHV
jgi:hypothetical protein